MADPRTRFLDVAGGRIAYDDTETAGPLVMLVPGIGAARPSYRPLRPLLVAAGYRVASMDLRGHGESSVGWRDHTQTAIGLDLVDLLRRLAAGPAVLVGNSYAAGAVVWAAAHAPDLVAGIVSMAGFLHPPDRARIRSSRPAVTAMLGSAIGEGRRWAGSVTRPALVVMGTRDPLFPDPVAEARAQGRLLDCPVRLISGAGHYPQHDCPQRTADVLLPFLATTTGKATTTGE